MFACAPFMGGLGVGDLVAVLNATIINVSAVTGIKSNTLTIGADGSIGFTGGGTGSVSAKWLNNIAAGAGASYWVQFVITSSTNSNQTTTGPFAWMQVSAPRSLTVQNTGAALEGMGTFTINFSLDGGLSTVKSFSGSWDVGYTP